MFNPLECIGNYSVTSNDMKLVHWPLMGGLLHLEQRRGDWARHSPPRPLLAVPNHATNVTAHHIDDVPITVLMTYNGPLSAVFLI